MSSSVFPSLPGIDIAVERESFFKTTIHETASGKEDRTAWMNTPRYRYRVAFNVLRTSVTAPSPWGAYSEPGVIINFLDAHKGAQDSFLFDDPYTAVQTRVRFQEDSLNIKQIASGFWECSFELVSVAA
jgi:phage-related protein